jgi:hypothetical protein
MRVEVEGVVTRRIEDFVLEKVLVGSHRQAETNSIFVDPVEDRGLSSVVVGVAYLWARSTLSLPCCEVK